MRLIINSNDKITGDATNFTVLFNLMPEDMNKRYKVFIKQAIISYDPNPPTPADPDDAVDAFRPVLYLSSDSIIPIDSEYNTRYNNTMCMMRRDYSNDCYYYQNDGIENFVCQGIPQKLNFSIQGPVDDTLLTDIDNTIIVLNLVEDI